MTSKELSDTFKKFETLLESINKEINASSISNDTLGSFNLKFTNGKCTMICVEDPPGSGREICFCERK